MMNKVRLFHGAILL